jgi:hypothetical protein
MSEEITSKSQPDSARVERILFGRQPMGMTLVPGGTLINTMVEGPAPAGEDRGRQPVPTTPVPASGAPSPAPSTPEKK